MAKFSTYIELSPHYESVVDIDSESRNPDMWQEYIVIFLKMIVDGVEDFFTVLTYPSRKYIETAILISFGFIAFSIVCTVMGIFTIVNPYDAIATTVMLFIIYIASAISSKDITKVKSMTKSGVKKIKEKVHRR